jgi:hypothetical protein
MPSADLTSTRAAQQPAADLQAPCLRSLPTVARGHQAGFQALAHPEAATRQASAPPRVDRSRGRAACHATGRWLRRYLAESARAWALAAGVPPDLYDSR